MSEEVRWYHRVGPGLVTAAVVLGPGSIVTSSKAGAQSGYGLVWMLAASCLFMATFTSMGARVGCALEESFIQYIKKTWGKPLAVVTGFSAFFVAAGFQFGNNLGVAYAMEGVIPAIPVWVWPLAFTAFALAFMVMAKNVYHLLELVMRFFVVVMLLAFVGNLFFTGISPAGLAGGLVPGVFAEGEFLIAAGMLGTTFSAVAAFYQAYLVQAKGWDKQHLSNAIQDAWIGIGILGTMGLVIMIGAAQTLHETGGQFKHIGELASQLKGVLGSSAGLIFSLGLCAAAFSSFIANALIGGTLLADGLGLDPRMEKMPTRMCAAAALLIGCFVAIATMTLKIGGAQSVLIAQTSTIVASPLCAILLLIVANNANLMGELKNKVMSNVLGGIGLLILLGLAGRTMYGVVPRIFAMLGGGA
jgi:manganese transport protein